MACVKFRITEALHEREILCVTTAMRFEICQRMCENFPDRCVWRVECKCTICQTVNCGELVFLPCPDFTQDNAVEEEHTPVGSLVCVPGAVCYRVRGTTLLHWELDL